MKKIVFAVMMVMAGVCLAAPPTLTVTTYANPSGNPSRCDELASSYTGTLAQRGYNKRIAVDSAGHVWVMLQYASNPTMAALWGAADGSSFKVFDTIVGTVTATVGAVYSSADSTFFTASRSGTSSTGAQKIAVFGADTVRKSIINIGDATHYGSMATNLPTMAMMRVEQNYYFWYGRFNVPDDGVNQHLMFSSDDGANWTPKDSETTIANGLRNGCPSGYIWIYNEAANDLWRTSTAITLVEDTFYRGEAPFTSYGTNNAIYAYDITEIDDTSGAVSGPILGFFFLENKCLKFQRWFVDGTTAAPTQIGSTVTVLDSTIFGSPVSTRCFTHGQPQITVVGKSEQTGGRSDTIVVSYTRAPDTTNKGLNGVYCKVSFDNGATFQSEQTLVAAAASESYRIGWQAPIDVPLIGGSWTLWGKFTDSVGANADTLTMVKAVFGGAAATSSSRRRRLLLNNRPEIIHFGDREAIKEF